MIPGRIDKMKSAKFLVGAIAIIAVVALAAAFFVNRDGGSEVTAHEEPAHVEAIEGSELSRVTLTERAVERLDIQTAETIEQTAGGTTQLVVPYSAVIYDTQGNTWVFTNPEGRVYVREAITIERIDGDIAIVTEGPDVGTKVVTVGGALLFGTEVGVGH
jgi:hypothetical protein